LQLKQSKQQLAQLSSQLNTVSPLATLARGYSITFDDKQQVVTSSSQLKAGDKVAVKLAEGGFDAQVIKLNEALAN
jgi:exodeoxyribonuclease VII large subunit